MIQSKIHSSVYINKIYSYFISMNQIKLSKAEIQNSFQRFIKNSIMHSWREVRERKKSAVMCNSLIENTHGEILDVNQ